MNSSKNMKKIDLQTFDLSDYTIKHLLEGLNVLSVTDGVKEYAISEVKASVEKRLLNSRVQIKNKEKLKRLLVFLNGESNIIEVDFLRRFSLNEKAEVFQDRIQTLEIQEQRLIKETEILSKKARQMVSSK
jgi:pyruvate-formate lyase-activating enzyme